MAMADGLFVANEIDRDPIDLLAQFEAAAVGILAVADHLSARSGRSRKAEARR
jgi:hypothetical protein